MVSYTGHKDAPLGMQVNKLKDGEGIVSQDVCFVGDSVLISKAVLKVPEDGFKVNFDEHARLSERVFLFSRESILKLKNRTNNRKKSLYGDGEINLVDLIGKEMNDEKVTELLGGGSVNLEAMFTTETMAGIESDPEFMETRSENSILFKSLSNWLLLQQKHVSSSHK
uniref:Chloramphenicol acetyltransferase-like domain-containing protein n=1 Tax=Tanacetum cinerariifolium TaxID=118510 RepID=A0A699IKQ3_TANCI|nr:chloramphenicol acetyltransferase-like domain-containing protein [Tanacetum cinerariifolium]